MSRHVYPAHGWLPEGAHLELEWDDQGRDLATNWRGPVQAPGAGVVLAVLSDVPFPDGFGGLYPVVRIDTGAWAGHDYYLGHTTSAVRPMERFSFGEVLSHADQGHVWAGTHGGWVELGEAPGGRPGPKAPSHWYDRLIESSLVVITNDPPLRFGDQGIRVLGMTSRLRDCGWLSRPWWHFNRAVHGAVVAFKRRHRIPLGRPDGGVVDHRTDVALSHAAAMCRKRHRREVRR